MRKSLVVFVVSVAMFSSVITASDVQDMQLKLPFPAGQTWFVTTEYDGSETHKKSDRYALDFSLPGYTDIGMPVLAITSGSIEKIGYSTSGGNFVHLQTMVNGNRYRIIYYHLVTITVAVGDIVVRGQQLGLCGNTGGLSFGSHIHIAIYPVDTSGRQLPSIKPEPMDGYTGFALSEPYTSTNSVAGFVPVGYTSNELDTGFTHSENSSSVKFAEAHRRNTKENKLRIAPAADSGNPSGVFVHSWWDVLVQNYEDTNFELRGILAHRPGASRAYALRAGFWNQYRYNDGPNLYGAPLTDEMCWIDPATGTSYQAAQQFERALMKWNTSMGSQIVVQTTNLPSPSITPQPCNTIHAAGSYTGPIEQTFKITAQSVAYNQVVLSVQNTSGIAYDWYNVVQDGTIIGNFTGNTTSISIGTVQPNTTYEYQLQGKLNNWGTVSVTEAITVTTPPIPGAFDLYASARTATIVDITVVNGMDSSYPVRIWRDNTAIATIMGTEFTDMSRTADTTYSYQGELLTPSGSHVAWSNVVTVTTLPPMNEPPPPPPTDPVYPIRLADGVHLISPAPPDSVMVNGCTTVSFTLENVGTASITLDSVIAMADVDMIFQQVQRYFQRETLGPLTLMPGSRYTYLQNNCGNTYPGVYSRAVVKPYFKVHSVGGDKLVTDKQTGTDYLSFEIVDDITNPDLMLRSVIPSPTPPLDGDYVRMHVTIFNGGNRLAPSSDLKIVCDVGGEQHGTVPQISVEATASVTFDLGVHAAGTYHCRVHVDPLNLVHEWLDADNFNDYYYIVGYRALDSDGDGVVDGLDNCLTVSNPSQTNSDGDVYGDACDNCPNVTSSDQTDADSDGFGAPCDCNDSNATIKPGVADLCDGVDNDCNGQIDNGFNVGTACTMGTGDCARTGVLICASNTSTTCNATAGTPVTWYPDTDNDGYGFPTFTKQACSKPTGYVSVSGDCNDSNAAVKPGATELCDSIDNNCNGQVDESGCVCSSPGLLGMNSMVTNFGRYANAPSMIWNGSQYSLFYSAKQSNGTWEIFSTRLTAAGVKIGSDSQITRLNSSSYDPSAAWNGTEFGIAFLSYSGGWEIYFARADVNGNPIGTSTRLTFNAAFSAYPSLVWNGSEYGLTWWEEQDGNAEVYFAQVDRYGKLIGALKRVTNDSSSSILPKLTWNGSGYAVVWYDNRNVYYDIYFARLDRYGVKIGNDVRIDSGYSDSYEPTIIFNGQNYGVAWGDTRNGKTEIYFAKVDLYGARMTSEIRITNAIDSSSKPQLVWTGSEYGLEWSDRRSGDWDIYFTRLSSTGVKLVNDIRVTNSIGASMFPSLIWTGQQYGLAWYDERTGVREEYFQRIGCN